MWAWIKSLFRKAEVKPVASYKWNPYWSEVLSRLIRANLETFEKASDINNIRPDWSLLGDEQKAEVMAAFFKRLIFFESGYDPLCESVDVGNKHDKQTWSVGLMQLSGVDKANLGLPVGWDYEGLKNPENNITQGIAIMVNQIKKRGKILITKGEKGNPSAYWSVLIVKGKYSKIHEIISFARDVKFYDKNARNEKNKGI